jgi:hypothetical protein
VRKYWHDLVGAFSDFSFQVVEVRDLGDHTLSALDVTNSAPSALNGPERGSGVTDDAPGTGGANPVVEQVNWILAEIRDGRVVGWGTFRSEAEAPEAAGLRE